jgi:hypothetical protein
VPGRRTDRVERPTVSVVIELGPALAALASTAEGASFGSLLCADVNTLLDRLGLSGEAKVKLALSDSTRPLRVTVNGRVQPYAPDLMRQSWVSVAPADLRDLPVLPARRARRGFPAQWLADYAGTLAARDGSADWNLLFAFVERLALAAIREGPACLLGPAQVDEYATTVAEIAREDLQQLLSILLDLGVTVTDRELVDRLIREGAEIDRPIEDTAEAAFTHLRSHRVEIHVHPGTLEGLLQGLSSDGPRSVYWESIADRLREPFRVLESAFFAAFGFFPPDIVWAPSAAMRQATLAVKINDWLGPPIPAIDRGERLVDASLDELRPIAARAARHPVSGQLRAIVADADRPAVENREITTWGPVDYVALNVFAELSQRAPWLLAMEDVEYQLAELQGSYAVLVSCALAQQSLGELTRVSRALLDEGLSLRDFPGILERLLHYDTVPLDPGDLVLFDDRLPLPGGEPVARWRNYYEFLRKQLKSQLSHKYASDGNRILVHRLDTRLAASLASAVPGDAEAEALRDAVWAGPPHEGHVVLTTDAARAPARALLAPEFPGLPVLASSELRADLQVDEVRRIALRRSGGRGSRAN